MTRYDFRADKELLKVRNDEAALVEALPRLSDEAERLKRAIAEGELHCENLDIERRIGGATKGDLEGAVKRLKAVREKWKDAEARRREASRQLQALTVHYGRVVRRKMPEYYEAGAAAFFQREQEVWDHVEEIFRIRAEQDEIRDVVSVGVSDYDEIREALGFPSRFAELPPIPLTPDQLALRKYHVEADRRGIERALELCGGKKGAEAA